jgi:hypothetical protein
MSENTSTVKRGRPAGWKPKSLEEIQAEFEEKKIRIAEREKKALEALEAKRAAIEERQAEMAAKRRRGPLKP